MSLSAVSKMINFLCLDIVLMKHLNVHAKLQQVFFKTLLLKSPHRNYMLFCLLCYLIS